jgi:hypothetical protein
MRTKKRNKSGHRCRLRSIIIRFSLTAFFFSFLLISFISEKSHRSSDVRCMHAHIVVIHINNIYLYVYRIVWWSLVNANRRLIICLSIDVHVILFGTKKTRRGGTNDRKNITMNNHINRTSLNCHLFDDVDHYASP